MHGSSITTIRINGGRLCLDFVNTASWDGADIALDFLTTPQAVADWGMRRGLLVPTSCPPIQDLDTARQLRAALRFLLCPATTANDRSAQARSLAVLQRAMSDSIPHMLLRPGAAGLQLTTRQPSTDTWLTGPVVLSAVELLTSEALARVKMCPGHGCHWLFLDATRAGTRRWCSMESCGNRVKARKHYSAHRMPATRRLSGP